MLFLSAWAVRFPGKGRPLKPAHNRPDRLSGKRTEKCRSRVRCSSGVSITVRGSR